MDTTISIDLGQVARDQGLPLDRVQRTVELLDEGNTVPFITRYRKDQTGGLDEEQIRRILEEVAKQRQLAERKQTILKSVELQGKLTAELAAQIKSARSPKHLEDLYLPFKPKKQTLATLARQRGLEPLALEILNADPAASDLLARAAELVNPEKKLGTVDDVLAGVRHLLAEQFSERPDLRSRLRRIVQRSGKLVSTRIEPSERRAAPPAPLDVVDGTVAPALSEGLTEEGGVEHAHDDTLLDEHVLAEHAHDDEVHEQMLLDAEETQDEGHDDEGHDDEGHDDEGHDDEGHDVEGHDVEGHDVEGELASVDLVHGTDSVHGTDADAHSGEAHVGEAAIGVESTTDSGGVAAAQDGSEAVDAARVAVDGAGDTGLDSAASTSGEGELASTPEQPNAAQPNAAQPSAVQPSAVQPKTATVTRAGLKPTAIPPLKLTARQQARAAAREAKKKKKQKLIESLYKDYYKYQEPLSRVPPHRVLAINRGERSQVLRVRVDADTPAMEREAEELLAPPTHPHAEFLKTCVHDALARLVFPSLEREVRREMTERAEKHAVDVFVRNLRKLLLQPPVHGRRVLAIDPGFRSGCKLAALDEFGNLVDHGTIHIIGPEQHRQLCRSRLVDLIRKHHLSVIAIGNGTACRETEQLVADILANELREDEVEYVIVNEAGASVYSTSPIGREELPKYDATVRGAVSIGRRLLDPLSELVKINPANIGVGLYQHDLKAKHLRESLDAVVESCVNYVGVDVNTASPALLRYVSGLNQLTARRLYEYRLAHGPFRSREDFKEVPGFGDATFVQSAGFLKIYGGNSPLDATWIHPESYDVARRVLDRLESSEADLALEVTPTPTALAASASGTVPATPSVFAGDVLGDPALTTASDLAPVVPVVEPTSEAIPGDVDSGDMAAASAGEPRTDMEDSSSSSPSESGGAAEVSVPSVAAEQVGATAETSPIVASPAGDPPVAAAAPTLELAEGAAVPAIPAEGGEVVGGEARMPLAERVARVDAERLATELGVGTLLLDDMLSALARPTRDPREDLPPPVFRRGIVKLEDLQPGMELSGTVLNVVDFGVFVDIGLSDSALVHISRLADRFIKDPHEVVGIGDVLKVWVVDVDKQRRRVSLTAIQPGSERPREPRPPRPPKGENRGRSGGPPPQRRQGGQTAARPPQQGGQTAARPPHQGGGRPAQGPPRGGRPVRPTQHVQKPKKSTPAPPITKGMIEGSEPMRTFSDLLQFYQKKKEGDEPK